MAAPGQERHTPERRDGAQRLHAGQRHHVEAAGKSKIPATNSQPARPKPRALGPVQHDEAGRRQRQPVPRVVGDRGLPHVGHLGAQARLESVGAKSARRDGEEHRYRTENEREARVHFWRVTHIAAVRLPTGINAALPVTPR